MKLRALLVFCSLSALPTGLALAQTSSETPAGALQLAHKTEAPGLTLSPGSYNIRIADHLKDRYIVQIQRNGGTQATLLAYPNTSLNGSGAILYGSGLNSKPTLRGYAFSSGPTVEFIYPKADAVALAKANNVQVMAVDPASENRPKLPQLTQSDMDEVTLWMLTPTPVEPGTTGPGIQAARYQVPSSAGTVASAPAPAAPAAQPAPPAPSYASANASSASASAPVQVASNERPHVRPNVKSLPHTASNQPLVELGGLVSLLLACGLGVRRYRAGVQA